VGFFFCLPPGAVVCLASRALRFAAGMMTPPDLVRLGPVGGATHRGGTEVVVDPQEAASCRQNDLAIDIGMPMWPKRCLATPAMGPSMHAQALGPRTSNFEAYMYDFELARPPAFLILKQFFGLFVPKTWRLIVSTRLYW
jgi:hypothetical protein